MIVLSNIVLTQLIKLKISLKKNFVFSQKMKNFLPYYEHKKRIFETIQMSNILCKLASF